jgi:Na+/alanine symporter
MEAGERSESFEILGSKLKESTFASIAGVLAAGVGDGEVAGVALFIATPLDQTNLLPFLMQV